ncbi:hypothetical protein [Candidatus Poriferisodalis sp.]|uniref:hypothetical protein n=1 Tax=Candidatus Poriferisodalis sp. TaxID=3101277 RepID=UPI003B0242E6
MTTEGDSDTESPSTAPVPAIRQPSEQTSGLDAANRRLLVPVLTTVLGALIAGVFLLAVAGFNTLRSDIQSLRDDMKTEIGTLRSDMKTEIGTLRSDMNNEIGTLRSDMNNEIGTLRSDMNNEAGTLRSDMNNEAGTLRSEMAGFREDTDARFEAVNTRLDAINAVLLDHTDRLARIETHLDIRPAS